MDKREIEFRQLAATEQVRSSFYALNVLVDTFVELSENHPTDSNLRDAVRALYYTSHDLFNRITVMKIWDQMTVDSDGIQSQANRTGRH